MNPLMQKSTHPLVVIWRGFGVRFHTNVCGKVYSLVAVEDATPFDTFAEATEAVRNCNLKASDYQIINPPILDGDAA